jgi:hypothetical protein
MSHGAKPVAVAIGLAAFLSAGIAAACPSHATHSASAATSDSVATTVQPSTERPAGVRG